MTVPMHAGELGARLRPPTREPRQSSWARSWRPLAAGDGTLHLLNEGGKQTDVMLSPALSNLLVELLRHIGQGDAVVLVPVNKMLTTQQAADILNVSRPHLIGLLEKGEIAYSLTGRHRRISAEDLFAYKRRRNATREAAFDELARLDADHL